MANRLAARWRELALCAQVDELFFPDKGEPTSDAKHICALCEVRAECLTDALDHRETHGVWAGLTARERRHLLCEQHDRTRRVGRAA